MLNDINYGDYKTTVKVIDGQGDPIAEIISWKEKIAQAVITMVKELKDEGLPITGMPGNVSVTLQIEKKIFKEGKG